MHFMRQTDSLLFLNTSIMVFIFEPQLFNLKNIDGRAACEFPILYYITSLLSNRRQKDFLLVYLFDDILYWIVLCISISTPYSRIIYLLSLLHFSLHIKRIQLLRIQLSS